MCMMLTAKITRLIHIKGSSVQNCICCFQGHNMCCISMYFVVSTKNRHEFTDNVSCVNQILIDKFIQFIGCFKQQSLPLLLGYEFHIIQRFNDDLCSCLFLFGWLTEQEYFKNMTDINTNAVLSERFKKQLETENYIPFGFMDNGINEHEYPKLNQDQIELLS